MMSTQTFEASSVDKALEDATAALGLAADEFEYKVEEKASDFWGLGETGFVVTVTLPEDEPAQAEDAAAAMQAETSEPEQESAATTETAGTDAASADATEEDAAPEQKDPTTEETPRFFSYTESAPAAAEAAAADDADAANPPPPPAAEAATPADTGDAPADAASVDGTDLTKEAAGVLEDIFAAMGFGCTAEAKLDGDTMQVAITGEDNQYLLEGRGRGLAALELILNHSFRAWPNRAHKRVRVDAGDFRSQRDDEIRDMAYQVAHLAKETGAEQQTSELNPYERRIVHLTLAADPRVTTRSLGNGFLKAVNVIPGGELQRRDR
jgi:predicted RNA-binding protein Jag